MALVGSALISTPPRSSQPGRHHDEGGCRGRHWPVEGGNEGSDHPNVDLGSAAMIPAGVLVPRPRWRLAADTTVSVTPTRGRWSASSESLQSSPWSVLLP